MFRGVPLLAFISLIATGLLAWEYFISDSQAFFFSRPSEIYAATISVFSSGEPWTDIGASVSATLLGLAYGTVFAIAATVLLVPIQFLRRYYKAVVVAVGAVPILGVAPLFLIWFGVGLELKVALSAVMTFLAVALGSLIPFAQKYDELQMFRKANTLELFPYLFKIGVPTGIESLLAPVPSAISAAFLGVFVGEFVSANHGIGYKILRTGALFQTDFLLAWSLIAALFLASGFILLKFMTGIITIGIQRLSVARLA
ncbi:MAG: hypothetical protein RIA71_14350 [Oceanicaulis sp.]